MGATCYGFRFAGFKLKLLDLQNRSFFTVFSQHWVPSLRTRFKTGNIHFSYGLKWKNTGKKGASDRALNLNYVTTRTIQFHVGKIGNQISFMFFFCFWLYEIVLVLIKYELKFYFMS